MDDGEIGCQQRRELAKGLRGGARSIAVDLQCMPLQSKSDADGVHRKYRRRLVSKSCASTPWQTPGLSSNATSNAARSTSMSALACSSMQNTCTATIDDWHGGSKKLNYASLDPDRQVAR